MVIGAHAAEMAQGEGVRCGMGGGDGAAERRDCAYPRAERQRSAWEVGRGATR